MLEMMPVTLEQQKVISHPLRSDIVLLLATNTMTAKQVALHFNKTAGSVHYHIKLLYTHGIIDIHHTNLVNGIIEKYYQSKATQFYLESIKPIQELFENVHSLPLSINELETFNEEIRELILKYELNAKSKDGVRRFNHEVRFSIEEKTSKNSPA